MNESATRFFTDAAGDPWEAIEASSQEPGAAPGARRLFFRSLRYPEAGTLPGPVTMTPLKSLSLERLRSFVHLSASRGGAAGNRKRAARAKRPSQAAQPARPAASATTPPPTEGIRIATPAKPAPPAEADRGARAGERAPALARDRTPPTNERASAAAAEAVPVESLEPTDAPLRRRHLYRGLESARVPPCGFRCRVKIAVHDREYTGEAEGPDVPGARAEIAAQATLAALQSAGEAENTALALHGAKVLNAFDRPVVVAWVYGLEAGEATPLVGACPVRDSIEQAAIQATLQATDRWIAWKASRQAR